MRLPAPTDAANTAASKADADEKAVDARKRKQNGKRFARLYVTAIHTIGVARGGAGLPLEMAEELNEAARDVGETLPVLNPWLNLALTTVPSAAAAMTPAEEVRKVMGPDFNPMTRAELRALCMKD